MSFFHQLAYRPGRLARRSLQAVLAAVLLITLLAGGVLPGEAAAATPTIAIVEVEPGETVTIRTAGFPANQDFTVLMGKFGTRGVGGIAVATVNSGSGGTFEATFDIPDELRNEGQIHIRLESAAGYFAYNWFYNQPAQTGTSTPPPATPPASTPAPGTGGYRGIPTFKIQSVVAGESVTVLTNNFPPDQTFTVRMGKIGTRGIGGVVAGTVSTGQGGAFEAEILIPESLRNENQIAIRMDSQNGYFAYNWFYNRTTTAGTPPPAATRIPGYSGIPTFRIASVENGVRVTIVASNFPPDQTFTVRMGEYGTRGIGGTAVAEFNSGQGGAFEATFDIPSALRNRYRIAIRLDSPQGFFAYNWFFNGGTEPPGAPATTGTPSGVASTPAPAVGTIPTFSILRVTEDQSVTIVTRSFPANQTFTVRMGKIGTRGVGGIVVGTVNSGQGGSFEATFQIPADLRGDRQIAIRLDSEAGYFAYNWFWNTTN